jgi:hypothetical protein
MERLSRLQGLIRIAILSYDNSINPASERGGQAENRQIIK